MWKKGLIGLGFAALFCGAPVAAKAMPVDQGVKSANEKMTGNVAYGCGRGWTRNRWGRCVPIRRYWGPPVYVVPRFYYGGPRYHHRRHYFGPRQFYGHRHYARPRYGHFRGHRGRW